MTVKNRIYMDHHATTPVDPRVLEAMLPYFTDIYGNAASIDHDFGYEAKQAVERARAQTAKVIGARSEEIVFTSGATESDNLALFGVMEHYADKGDHLITCVTEHKAILDAAKHLEEQGKTVTYLPVDQYGLVDPDAVKKAITSKTVLISIMMANNEIGTIAPIREIGSVAHEHGVLFHTDAAQAVGHIPVDVQKMNIDLLSISAHKIYGPKGVGALYVRNSRPRVHLTPRFFGGGHERGLRSGTLNVPGIVGLGKALEIAGSIMRSEARRLEEMRDFIFAQLSTCIDGILLNGHPMLRLPHNLNISIAGIESKSLVMGLSDIALSTGSACTSFRVDPSHVLAALNVGEETIHSSIRIGLGRWNTNAEAQYLVDHLVEQVNRIRHLALNS